MNVGPQGMGIDWYYMCFDFHGVDGPVSANFNIGAHFGCCMFLLHMKNRV